MGIPFEPTGDTLPIAATSTSQNTNGLTALNPNSQRVRVLNVGPNIAFIRLGVFGSTLTADATKDMPVAVGAVEVFTKNGNNGVAAVCLATQTAALYFTPGEGE